MECEESPGTGAYGVAAHDSWLQRLYRLVQREHERLRDERMGGGGGAGRRQSAAE